MAAEQGSGWGERWGQVVARAWTDEAFKQRLLADPAAALQEHGLAVPPGVTVRVVEDTDRVVHLALPKRPGPGALGLSEAELAAVAGGAGNMYGNSLSLRNC